jgi:hypothetical protein
VRCHEDICPASGQGNVNVKEMIRLFVHQCVRFRIASDGMAIDAIGTSGIIEGGVEQVLSIAAPGDTIVGIGNRSIQQRAGCQIFDEKRIRFRSIHIDRPGEPTSIVRWSKDSDTGEGVSFRQCVDIEEDLFLRIVNGATAHHRVLSPCLSAREVHERSVAIRNAFILLAQSAAHLAVQALTQPGSVRRHLFRVAVFGFKMGDDLRVIAFAHPEVVVDHLIAVDGDHVRSLWRNRGCWHSPSLSRMIVQRLSIISYRLSAISYRLSAIGYQLSAISYRLSAIAENLAEFVVDRRTSAAPLRHPRPDPVGKTRSASCVTGGQVTRQKCAVECIARTGRVNRRTDDLSGNMRYQGVRHDKASIPIQFERHQRAGETFAQRCRNCLRLAFTGQRLPLVAVGEQHVHRQIGGDPVELIVTDLADDLVRCRVERNGGAGCAGDARSVQGGGARRVAEERPSGDVEMAARTQHAFRRHIRHKLMIGATVGHHTSLPGAINERQNHAGFTVAQANNMRLDPLALQVGSDEIAEHIRAQRADEPGRRTAARNPCSHVCRRSPWREFDAAGSVTARKQQSVRLYQNIPYQIANCEDHCRIASLMEIENLIRYAPLAVGLMEIENLFRYPALAVGLKPSASQGEARLRGL